MRDLYSSSSIEIDLRDEVEKMFSGDTGEIPKQQRFVLRKIRLSEDVPVPCACRDELTKEGDSVDTCPFCIGEGYYWDEEWVFGYVMYNDTKAHQSAKRTQLQPGLVSAYDKIFYLRYSETITYNDKIIELKLDSDGNPLIPYKRKAIYRPETIVDYRSDFGRKEYIAIYVNENPGIRTK